jgi:hypothetical protein
MHSVRFFSGNLISFGKTVFKNKAKKSKKQQKTHTNENKQQQINKQRIELSSANRIN